MAVVSPEASASASLTFEADGMPLAKPAVGPARKGLPNLKRQTPHLNWPSAVNFGVRPSGWATLSAYRVRKSSELLLSVLCPVQIGYDMA